MNNVKRNVLAGLSSLVLVAGVWAMPRQAPSAPLTAAHSQSTAQPQSVSGKITAVDKSSFTLNVVAPAATPGQSVAQMTPTPKSMTFQIDGNTTVDGKLKVDSNAEVTYREDNGANIAISVRVAP